MAGSVWISVVSCWIWPVRSSSIRHLLYVWVEQNARRSQSSHSNILWGADIFRCSMVSFAPGTTSGPTFSFCRPDWSYLLRTIDGRRVSRFVYHYSLGTRFICSQCPDQRIGGVDDALEHLVVHDPSVEEVQININSMSRIEKTEDIAAFIRKWDVHRDTKCDDHPSYVQKKHLSIHLLDSKAGETEVCGR